MSKSNELWMVYEHELGLIGVYDDEDEASLAYEQTKDNLNEDIQLNGGILYGDERVIIAKIKKDFLSIEAEGYKMRENEYEIQEKIDASKKLKRESFRLLGRMPEPEVFDLQEVAK
ncbi:hypothetical protein [Bacillus pumilus]|uniref:hypothetical protein n=1 Tax=Bacillus pumilus TaxID=1408 RepID=UPI002280E6E3|nr:hypothetical protein [Bacillus pumilus]MCY7500157.1 hypothetical protein [Bacillus pumilus]MCY7528519.1 hypothetical protein [Bacillus pumilus]MED4439523.1 hypothetical protein [Bacillus pumilus]MED4489966.1 hypothetical protein [Bacillus pumilus]